VEVKTRTKPRKKGTISNKRGFLDENKTMKKKKKTRKWSPKKM
jgi:hypothetical protein